MEQERQGRDLDFKENSDFLNETSFEKLYRATARRAAKQIERSDNLFANNARSRI